ncbi:MAG TPA: YbhN family protein [Gaiellaceae bacterium]|nr:YbhN family protein [Gaiellaceae bacterium]
MQHDRPAPRRRVARSAVLLALTGITLYLLLPSLLAVFGSWRSLTHLDWRFAALALVAEIVSFICLGQLDRIVLRTDEWFPVMTARLSANAAGRLLPGGGATSTAVEVSMLRTAGIDATDAAGGLTASTLLQIGTALALPLVTIPAIIAGVPIKRSLATAAYLGAIVLVLLIALGAWTLTSDVPLTLAGRAIQWVLNKTVRRRNPISGLPEQMLKARDSVRDTLGRRWKEALLAAAGNTAFDYLALLASLRAVGASPQPSLVVLAYAAAEVLALIPFTPGGLGFVEAGLAGTLRLAGVKSGDALAATLVYRLVSYWLPLLAGGFAYVLFRRRYGAMRDDPMRE